MYTKLQCLITLYLLLCLHINAQRVIGINAGISLSSLQLQKVYKKAHPGLGANLGFDYLLKLNSSFEFESGVFYRQKDQKYNKDLSVFFLDGSFATVDQTNEYQLNYLQLPLNLNYKFNSDVFVTGGIYFAYVIDSYYIVKSKYSFHGTKKDEESIYREKLHPNNPGPSLNIDRGFNKFDFGLTFGGGYRFGRFCAKTEFNLGLINALIIEDPDFMRPQTWKYKNRSLSISLIYYLNDNYYKIRNLQKTEPEDVVF